MLIKLFGVPGAGKTTECLKIILHLVGHTQYDAHPFLKEYFGKFDIREIGFTTFTRSGMESITNKMLESGFERNELNHFGTLNTLTWRLSGFNKLNILPYNLKKSFFSKCGVNVIAQGESEMSEMQQIEDFYNNVCGFFMKKPRVISYEPLMSYANQYVNERNLYIRPESLASISIEYDKFLYDNHKCVYIDSLLKTYANRFKLQSKVLIVDEAQDLNPLQSEVIRIWEESQEIVILSGDDDQTVHEWNGANPEFMMTHKREPTYKIMLEYSYRLPENVAQICNKMAKHIQIRENKELEGSRKSQPVDYYESGNTEFIWNKIEECQKRGESVFLLFRTNRIKKRIENTLFKDTNLVFEQIGGGDSRYAYYSDEFIRVSNAINKLVKGIELTRFEVQTLFSKMHAKECLVHGALTKLQETTQLEFTADEVLKMTKRWRPQHDLTQYVSQKSKNLKRDIVDFIYFNKNGQKTFAAQNKELQLQKKLAEIDYLFPEDETILVKTGTFHASKGLEAENVFVFLGTSGTFSEINDSEIRCLYTACSRTFNRLFFVSADVFNKEKVNLQDFAEKFIK